jgi:hypothetical protein
MVNGIGLNRSKRKNTIEMQSQAYFANAQDLSLLCDGCSNLEVVCY